MMVSPHIAEAIRYAVKAVDFRLYGRGAQQRRYADRYSRMSARALDRAYPPKGGPDEDLAGVA